ncbi:uncharacterized protein [Procambarus clarkii]|uniref:uncharacterized protein n=1 Tax=Procambarus clarkii TaxID=6728 RepID=UPI001E671656|nr:uncharacterized protein LOC123754495 [Procambarus clarkii]
MESGEPKVIFKSDLAVPQATAAEFHWGRRQVHTLISKVEEFFEDFYDGTKKKKFIWNAVAKRMQEEGFNCTGSECDKKWRNLKGTYVKVLQKQIHGDNSYRFEYFDSLHHILGKEIDPLGMREQAMTSGAVPQPENKMMPMDYNDLVVDEGFVWTNLAVHLLLDLIQEHRDDFLSPSTYIDEIWEEVAQQMTLEGHAVHSKQCQHKWLNLQEGLRFYQMEAETTGSISLWAFYTRVRDIVNSMNVATNVPIDCKPVLESGGTLGLTRNLGRGRPETRRVVRAGKDLGGQDRSILDRVQELEASLSIDRRLEHLESRAESDRMQRDAYKQTNVVLKQILSELRRINSILEEEQSFQHNSEVQHTITHHQHQQQQQQEQYPGSPNQGIIIVEAYSGQL